MSAQRAREPRKPVQIGARLKSGRGWSDVVIRNVSARGVMGQCPAPPERGDYVEVRCGAYLIVARVAWSSGACFGARAQDPIALPELIACAEGRIVPVRDRRQQPRPVKPARPARSVADQAFASQRAGRACEFLSLVVAGVGAASLLGGLANDALAKPAERVSQALAEGGAR